MSESEYESDVEVKAPVPKKMAKPHIMRPTEEIKHEKKITTKFMIIDALTELNTRKGVSLYAIKIHLNEKFQVNTERLKYRIKKTLKSCVEDGTFVQLKGIGASGSFKLAANKVSKPKKKKETEHNGMEVQKNDIEKPVKNMKKTVNNDIPKDMKKVKESDKKIKATKKITEIENSVEEKKKKPKVAVEEKEKKTKVKSAKGSQDITLAKKRASMKKRKSIGSIIKPPTMKPKNK